MENGPKVLDVPDRIADPLVVEVDDLKKYFVGRSRSFFRGGRPVRAVDGVSFSIRSGRNFGLVGESGSGKTTIGKLVLGLVQPTSGHVRFDGRAVDTLRGAEMRAFRHATHAVFQDPNSSLSPRMRVRDLVAEPLIPLHTGRAARAARVAEVLQLVGLPADSGNRFAHEFSGGQRQRIAIARAVVANPKMIVLDEPVSALDVSIRAQILNLLRNLQTQLGITYLTVAHDLAVVYHACDDIGVMYLGRLCEVGPAEALYAAPLHPYTRILLSTIPQPDPKARRGTRIRMEGEIPSPSNPPPGCRFHTRCPIATDRCRAEEPEWREVEPDRWVACHFAGHLQ